MSSLVVLAVITAAAALALAATQTAFALRSAPDVLSSLDPPSTTASYSGRTIDLAISWEGARACAVTAAGNFCFDSLAERDRFLSLGPAVDSGRVVIDPGLCAVPRVAAGEPFEHDLDDAALVWAGAVRLYDGPGFSGSSIAFAMREIVVDLASYSFANMTSSFSIEACTSILRDEANTTYPCVTTSGASTSTMAPGWNDRVRSLQIG